MVVEGLDPAYRRPGGVNEKKYKNGRIVCCGRSGGSERDDSCVIADYTGTLFLFFPRNCRLYSVCSSRQCLGNDTLSLKTCHHHLSM